jgi:hypothetical protein
MCDVDLQMCFSCYNYNNDLQKEIFFGGHRIFCSKCTRPGESLVKLRPKHIYQFKNIYWFEHCFHEQSYYFDNNSVIDIIENIKIACDQKHIYNTVRVDYLNENEFNKNKFIFKYATDEWFFNKITRFNMAINFICLLFCEKMNFKSIWYNTDENVSNLQDI